MSSLSDSHRRLEGRLALITGCTGGIGRATALALARLGCSIAVHYHSAKEKASVLVNEITAIRVCADAFQADLNDLDAVRRLHAEVIQRMGHPDILFNNAGITGKTIGPSGKIEEITVEEFEENWKTNTAPTFLLTQLCIPHMEQQGFGRVIFCSSVAAGTGGLSGPGPHYSSSKSALHGLMHWIASRYGKNGITCNAVAPALISGTDMMANVPDDFKKIIPIGRSGVPEEVSSCVELLVTNDYMTNKIIVMDGGLTPSAF